MKRRILEYVDSQPWAITPDALQIIRSVAIRPAEERAKYIEAIERQLGRPLSNTRETRVRDGVAVVPVHGPLFRYANLFTDLSGATSVEELARDIGAAVDDPAVRAIILDVDSPGGEVNGIEEAAELIFQARGEKPIHGLVSGFGTSGAYWLVSAAEQVHTVQTGVLGSIGALLRIERRGDDEDEIVFVSSQSPRKNIDPGSDTGASEIQRMLDSMAQVFIDTVARNRGVTPDTVATDFGQGGLLVGAAAQQAGLADRVTTLETLITDLSGRSRGTSGIEPAAIAANDGGTMPNKDQNSDAPEAPEITRAYLEENHSELVAEIRHEGYAEGEEAGRIAGAAAERERILAIEDLAVPGHAELVAKLKRDPDITREEAAIRIVQATKQAGTAHLKALQDAEKDLDTPGPGARSGGESGEDGPSPEERAERALALTGIRPSKN